MNSESFMILLVSAAVCALIGAAIGERRGRPGAGLLFGFLLGPIGWVLILAGPDHRTPEQRQDTAATAVQPAVAATRGISDQILDLKKLLDAGAITEDEFNEKKKSLLARI